MGNDPVNLIDPSGGIGIPCPGASPLLQSIAKAGDAVIRVLDAIAPLSLAVSVGINITNATANIYNRSVEFQIVNRQLVRNGTGQVGAKGEWQSASIVLAESQYNGAGSGSDWIRNPNPEGINLDGLSGRSDIELLADVRSTIRTYTGGVLREVGDRMVDNFASNVGKDFVDPILNNHIAASTQFQESLKSALESVKSEIKRTNRDFSNYVKQTMSLPSFPKWDAGNPFGPNSLYTLIGGTQYGNITLVKYKYNASTNRFTGVINVTIMDDFGVSVDDVIKARNIPFSKGIRAMWYLQHVRGFKPFRTVFSRQFKITF